MLFWPLLLSLLTFAAAATAAVIDYSLSLLYDYMIENGELNEWLAVVS
jgi:hypothetical protein